MDAGTSYKTHTHTHAHMREDLFRVEVRVVVSRWKFYVVFAYEEFVEGIPAL